MKSKNNSSQDKELEKAQKRLEEAVKFLDKGKLDKSAEKFKLVRDKFPNLVTPWIGLGNVYAAKNNPKEACKNYEHALKILPSSEIYNNLGTLYFVQGDKVKAESYLKLAVQMDKENFQAKKNLADCYFASKQYQQAIFLYDQALRKKPDIDALISLANCYFKISAYESAKLGYKKVLEFDSDNKVAKENLELTKKKIETK